MSRLQKIIRKSQVWMKHGRHKGVQGISAKSNREQRGGRPSEMVASLRELFSKKGA